MTTTMRPSDQEQVPGFYSNSLLFLGVAMVVLGALAMITAFATTVGAVMVLGGLLVAAGVVELIHTLKAKHHNKRSFLNGLSALVYFVTGALMIRYPLVGAAGITLLLGAYLFMNGFINIAHGLRFRKQGQSGWFIFSGVVDLALGVVIAMGWPNTSLFVLGLFLAIELITYGTSYIAASRAAKEIELDLDQRLATSTPISQSKV